MKLRNKETGEIRKLRLKDNHLQLKSEEMDKWYDYDDLDYLAQWWERYEEDELFYIISAEHKDGYTCALKKDYKELCDTAKEFGLGFETEKEAAKAVKKLKAWKRLKDKGFRLDCYMRRSDWAGLSEVKALENLIDITVYLPKDKIKEMEADLDLLFGGEE